MNNKKNPAISIDCKRFRIRLHGSTLESLGHPTHVVLIINPEDMTIGIMGTNKNEPGAHKLYFTSRGDKNVEMCSRALLSEISRVCNEIEIGKSYRIEGRKIPNKNVVMFDILNYTELVKRSKADATEAENA